MLSRRDGILGGGRPAPHSAAAPVALRLPATRRSTALATTVTAMLETAALATAVLVTAVLATAMLTTAVLATAVLLPRRSRRVRKHNTPAPWRAVPWGVGLCH